MSQRTGDGTAMSKHSDLKSDSEKAAGSSSVVPFPIKTQLDALLQSAGWTYDDLDATQIRVLAGLVSERSKLVETIQNLNLELERAQSVADHDPLIPIYNRRAFVRELSRQLSFCYRYENRACLIYMDLDHFKDINDRFGHSTGDLALKKFGEVLIAHTRESDLIGRLGGDEFAVLLINASLDDARQKADMFRQDIEQMVFGTEPHALSLGVSFGVVAWERGEAPEALINRGDEAMYIDKRSRKRSASRTGS